MLVSVAVRAARTAAYLVVPPEFWLQLAVLSTKISTFGRIAENDGLARKMSVSSFTGSNAAKAAPAAASDAAASAVARMRRVMACSSVRQVVRAVAREHADLGALPEARGGVGDAVADRDVVVPLRVFGHDRLHRAVAARRGGELAHALGDGDRHAGRRRDGDRGGRAAEVGH